MPLYVVFVVLPELRMGEVPEHELVVTSGVSRIG
jgi:hypothetical protein